MQSYISSIANQSRGVNRYDITKEEYNYLLPVYGINGWLKGNGFITKNDGKFFFVGWTLDYLGMKNICKYL